MINFINRITQKAGEIILDTSVRILAKKNGEGNWVTEADKASEKSLFNAIRSVYPSHTILSEETESKKQDFSQIDNLWIIDPLDGTTNFAHSLPLFCVSVAYVENGVVKCGAIYDPKRKELFFAQKDGGAFLNGKPIHVQIKSTFSGALVDVGCPYDSQNFGKTYPLGKFLHKEGARIVNLGSGALECAYVASGRLSFYYEVGLKPWDIAAAYLIVKEAGGIMDSVLKPFSIFNPFDILVGNTDIVEQSKSYIKTVAKQNSRMRNKFQSRPTLSAESKINLK